MRNKCISVIRKAKSDFYLTSLANTQRNTASFWKTVKSLKTRPTSALPPQIGDENNVISDKSKMCDAFNHHFVASGLLFDRLSDSATPSGHTHDPVAENLLNPFPPFADRFSFRLVGDYEVFN